jgi:hypothetical protein
VLLLLPPEAHRVSLWSCARFALIGAGLVSVSPCSLLFPVEGEKRRGKRGLL